MLIKLMASLCALKHLETTLHVVNGRKKTRGLSMGHVNVVLSVLAQST